MNLVATEIIRLIGMAVLAAAITLASSASRVRAQSLEPMRGKVNSFADRFALQIYPGNPYTHTIKLDVRVYDEKYKQIEATVFPASFVIGAQEKRRVVVLVPFAGLPERRVKVCVESLPDPNLVARIRTQICASFTARNLRLPGLPQ